MGRHIVHGNIRGTVGKEKKDMGGKTRKEGEYRGEGRTERRVRGARQA